MTATPAMPTETPVPVSAALERLRLEGAIFLRAEYTEGWAFESLDGATAAGVLHPGARRIVFFHVVAQGRCWVSIEGGERHWAEAGDVVVLPFGHQHQMGGAEPAPIVPIMEMMTPPPWETLPVIVHGAGGVRTDIVCGYLHCQDPLFDPELRALPPVFVVRPPAGPAASWVQASIEFALQAGEATPTAPPARLSEALLIEVLRLHLATAPAADRGWISALRDPVIAPALALMHTEPEHKWTVQELAAKVAVSRSALDQRFREVVGRSPIRYLTEWRMHVAEDLLATTDLSSVAISRRVGYDSEEAFSRAFKRAYGESPSGWRSARAARRQVAL
jgi:AraC-like DNA-binding protein